MQRSASGNPFLTHPLANNVDFSLEWYFNPESLSQRTIFYKGHRNILLNQAHSEEKYWLILPIYPLSMQTPSLTP